MGAIVDSSEPPKRNLASHGSDPEPRNVCAKFKPECFPGFICAQFKYRWIGESTKCNFYSSYICYYYVDVRLPQFILSRRT